jgi:DNA-directed RNA polymerase subunit beta
MFKQTDNQIDFGSISEIKEFPNLLEVQKKSYNDFLQQFVFPNKRLGQGLEFILENAFPIFDFNKNSSLEYVRYTIGSPKYSEEECRHRGMTYSVPIRAVFRLVVRDRVGEGSPPVVKFVKEEEIYLGDLPLMNDNGVFIINGAERVIVSQLHRSPGILFREEIHPSGRHLIAASVVPYRGSWLELGTDINESMFFTIDRRRKLPASLLLRISGYPTDEDILGLFYPHKQFKLKDATPELVGKVVGKEIKDDAGNILAKANEELVEEKLQLLKTNGVKTITIAVGAENHENMLVRNTLAKDAFKSMEEAYQRIFSVIRPGDISDVETATNTFRDLFYDPRRYDLAKVGRMKLNQKLGIDVPLEVRSLSPEDLVAMVQYIVKLASSEGYFDDVDHLGNRRVRSVGELLEMRFQVGLSRMERIIKERMSILDIENCMPHDLVNTKPLAAAIKEFFGTSQLSQFLDQINPLAELTHKRRLSALGPGGLSRERAGFEVRDVHYTHYGRMCPIETPEGPNIGLISSLSTYARINEFGFIETPYRPVVDGKVTNIFQYLSAYEEDEFIIAQANAPLNEDGSFAADRILARYRGDFPMVDAGEIQYMDVSPKQLVSVSTSLIPFLEHDDANRALMGSNMQRQAVPLLTNEIPVVGTGMEKRVAEDCGVMVIARRPGRVKYVSSSRIVVDAEAEEGEDKTDIYLLTKFQRTNQDTCFNQKPLVKAGDKIKAGDVLADGPSTCKGELALGRNVLVSFMPWMGYNFEDAILISERLVHDDYFTSVHIEEFELDCRDTKLGKEEITRDIPNVSSETLRNLDAEGIIRIGADVKAGDILIGKVTPKGETELTPEEKLLRAIFGEKAVDVRDASLKAPPGMDGVVVDVKVYQKKERERDARERAQETEQITLFEKDRDRHVAELTEDREDKLKNLLMGKILSKTLNDPVTGEKIASRSSKVDADSFVKLLPYILAGEVSFNRETDARVETIINNSNQLIYAEQALCEKRIDSLRKGDELPPAVLKLVKVYVARKRKLSVGDKISGRHGNKGVIARILSEEDMPYLPDGTPVDMVLNPLGVPSRMNVGQLYETTLGWALTTLGLVAKVPVFDGAKEEEVKQFLVRAGLARDGKADLRDGRSGEPFGARITVGVMYILKLLHLADDKIHARSVGPYSLVTQQPLGGKGQFGGQRFGEMEVWALEAYGAAYTLQEMLTMKSDDVVGRARMYEAIVKGENVPSSGTPESFNVLLRELRALCLDIEPVER